MICSNNPLLRKLRWELLEGNELTRELADVPSTQRLESRTYQAEVTFPPNKSVLVLSAFLIAGMAYLVLRMKKGDLFLGIDFSSSTG